MQEYDQALRYGIIDFQRQIEISPQTASSGPVKIEMRSEEPTTALPDISETEIQAFTTGLNDVESAQIYERLQTDDLPYAEVHHITEATAAIDASTSTILELASEANYKDEDEAVDAIQDYKDEETLVEEQETAPFPETETCPETLEEVAQINELISDIEASFETIEQEIVGALLVDIFVADSGSSLDGFIETPLDQLDEDSQLLEVKLEDPQSPLERLTAYLDNYELSVKQAAVDLIGSIYEVVKELKSKTDLSDEDKQQLLVELEQTISELFFTLGIEVEDEQLHKYIELLLLTLDNEELNKEDFDMDYLNRTGTREYKLTNRNSLLSGLVQITSQELKHIKLIGKYTIQVSRAGLSLY